MSITFTILEQNQVQRQPAQIWQEKVDELTYILENVPESSLSNAKEKELFTWGAECLLFSLSNTEFTPDFQSELTERVNFLVQKILINCIDGATLENPVLVGDSIWESWMLDDYKTLCHLSPVDQGSLDEHKALPFPFAKALREWVNRLPLKISIVKKLTPEAIQSQDPILKMTLYCQLAKNLIIQQGINQICLSMHQGALIAEKLLKQTQEALRLENATFRAELRRQELVLNQSLENIESAHRSEAETHLARINEETRAHHATKERLDKVEKAAQQNAHELHALQQRFLELAKAHGNLQTLAQQKGGKGGKCQIM